MGTADTGEFYASRTPHTRPLTWALAAILLLVIVFAVAL